MRILPAVCAAIALLVAPVGCSRRPGIVQVFRAAEDVLSDVPATRAQGLKALREAAEDEDTEIQKHALAHLGLFAGILTREEKEQVLSSLVAILRGSPLPGPIYARETIQDLGPIALPAIVQILTDPKASARARWRVTQVVIGIASRGGIDAIVPALRRAASDPDQEVREGALAALRARGYPAEGGTSPEAETGKRSTARNRWDRPPGIWADEWRRICRPRRAEVDGVASMDLSPVKLTREEIDDISVETHLGHIEAALRFFRTDQGRLPQSLEELLAPPKTEGPESRPAIYLICEKGIPCDPWGTPYAYETVGEGYRLASLGVDQEAGTWDDVVIDRPAGQ